MSATTTAKAPRVRAWDGEVRTFIPPFKTPCDDKDVPYEPGRTGNAEQRAFQQKTCATCPLLIECASHAMNYEPYGAWGLTEHQRGHLGGVVPPEWSNRTMDPAKAIEELDAAGIGVDIVKEIVRRAGITHPLVLRALRDRVLAEKAEMAAYKSGQPAVAPAKPRRRLAVAS